VVPLDMKNKIKALHMQKDEEVKQDEEPEGATDP